MRRLNFGCGDKVLPGWVNADLVPIKKGVVRVDFERPPYPFKSGSFDYVLADNVFEHLSDTISTLRELHRMTSFGGVVEIVVPHYTSHDAWAHPQHKRAFAFDTFDFFTVGTKRYLADGRCFDFSFRRIERRLEFEKGPNLLNYLLEPLANAWPELYEGTFLSAFPCSRVRVTLYK